MAIDVKARKRALIKETVSSDPRTEVARREIKAFVCCIVLLRLAFFIYRCIYFSAVEIASGWVSDGLLLLGCIIILFMVTDGNKPLAWVTAISAVVWSVQSFTSVLPTLDGKAGADAYIGITLTVMTVQFVLSVIMATLPRYDTYFKKMQAVNLKLRGEMLGGRK